MRIADGWLFTTECFTMRSVTRLATILTIVCALVDPGRAQLTGSNKCGLERFQCRNGECIAAELLCDGKADCSDRSDESTAECTKPEILCPDYAFRCKYGACVNGDAVCNGIQDCLDNSDETQPQCATAGGNQSVVVVPCGRDEFTCDNGQCIPIVFVCNGRADCVDGSDEVIEKCGAFSCAPTVFQCAYGACVDGNLRCNGEIDCADGSDEDPKLCRGPTWPVYSPTPRPTPRPTPAPTPTPVYTPTPPPTKNACELPQQPPNGRWKLHPLHCADQEECDVQPGTKELPLGSLIVYSCNAGFKIRGTAEVSCALGGNWRTVPVCTEIRCKGLSTASVDARCRYRGKWERCETPVLPGTTANLQCRHSYRLELNRPLNQGNNVVCNDNGAWEPDPLRCVPECGVLPGKFTPLIVDGEAANITEFPWHASIYRDEPGDPKKFICGATIIQDNLLVTAAHCVFDPSKKAAIESRKLHILTGNVYRDYDSPLHNEIVKTAEVKNIYVECHYNGYEGNFASDIAILELVEPFVLSATLVPACIELSADDQLVLDNADVFGKVAGFGRTRFGETSYILQSLKLPYIPYSQCKSASKNIKTEHYITPDKFCAGYTNGSSVCQGDSGGGLVFPSNGLWFLRGIVSVSLGAINEGGESRCNNYLYSLFTRLSRYIEWAQEVIISLDLNRPYVSCADRF